jgi:hypothetical protein
VLKAIVPALEDLAMIVDAIGWFGTVTTSVVLGSDRQKNIGPPLLLAASSGEPRSQDGKAKSIGPKQYSPLIPPPVPMR